MRVSHLLAQAPHVEGNVITCKSNAANYNSCSVAKHSSHQTLRMQTVPNNIKHTSSGAEYLNKAAATSSLVP